jgi:uncharacterized protein YodC (DUF2158 family)
VLKVEINTKFEIGDEVRVKGTDKVGKIKSFKIDGYTLNDKPQMVIKYYVQNGTIYNDWYQEHLIEPYNSYEFENDFELGLIDFLINIYLLDKKNLHLIKKLHNSKSLYGM